MLPLLSEMVEAPWRGLSVLYVTPLRALLNSLYPRLTTYASWVGRRVRLWHGDVGASQRRRLLADPPDVLLTTPESLEAMLVSTTVDHRFLFADLRALVVDELHAFAGDDRGWHLLAVAERLQVLAGRALQRLGMTATVGNPEELLSWLTQGADGVVVAPAASGPMRPTWINWQPRLVVRLAGTPTRRRSTQRTSRLPTESHILGLHPRTRASVPPLCSPLVHQVRCSPKSLRARLSDFMGGCWRPRGS